MKRALIFGASGQDAHYLTALCAVRGIETRGVSRSSGKPIGSPDGRVTGDVSRREQVDALVTAYQPDYIFHLAANSTTRHDAVFENHETISTGSLNVLEAARTLAPNSKVFLCGSGVQFINRGLPISESDPFHGNSAYSVARIQSAYAARYYRSLGVRVYIGYLFHHESPLRKSNHVSQKIAQAARRIALGSGERLEIGDISVKKEWAFAGDVAQGMISLVSQDEVFEAVIGTGVAYSIENWLEQCFQQVGLDWREHTNVASAFRCEYSCLISNPTTMRNLGWEPKISFTELAAMMMSDHAMDLK